MSKSDMTVIKRDEREVAYSRDKITKAIYRAMVESGEDATEDDAEQVALDVETELITEFYNQDQIPKVEEIQDLVEEKLMKAAYVTTAKAYILYRNKRQQSRLSRKQEKENPLLTNEFLSKYKHQPNPFPTELGEFIYYRTYSRWLEEEQRREYWWETVKRAVEYNCSLAQTTKKEAEKLYDNVYNLRNFLAGRTLWTASTESSKKYGMSNYNCSFTVIDSFKAYQDLFYLLMIGSGVGFRVLPRDVEKLPKIRTDIEVIHKYYEPVDKEERREYTDFDFDEDDVVTINVGDSKEGWIQSLEYYFKFLVDHAYRPLKRIIFNYDSVRPKGEKLKTFGGTASGHQSLKRMFTKIDKLLKEKPDRDLDDINRVKLKPIDAMDLANIVAENVVSGGVRRSSQICLFSADDKEIAQAKSNLYVKEDDEWVINKEISHRQMSNNSIFYEGKPSKEQLKWHVKQMRFSGEPGFINAVEGSRRRENFKGVNPCAEILLDSRGVCNLTSLNVMAFVDEEGNLDKKSMFESQKLSARAGYRMALIEFELPEWDQINKRDRLIGTSLTGWQDMKNAADLNEAQEAQLLEELREIAHQAAREIAKEVGDNEPKLITTVKPEGTQTQMPTVSSGLHYSHSAHYVRRVRISASDPLARVCEELDYPIHPEVGQDPDDPETLVVEFPVKAPEGQVKGDVNAIDQLETYKMFMENYVDHNASITVHVRDDEWEDVEEWLWENWNSVVGISFISYNDNFYDLMPYEEITEEEYNQRVEEMERFNPSLVSKYETEYLERELDESSCEGGACPVR
ncbi:MULTISPECIES: ribonucleoside-triphosphate reductase, adenosylcobalamin-dependent [Halanaerobium]|uniref:Adenosylcobalamin-dependent ribonucleoside-triphosphate reductase n=1 Tax=Halanaerobium kushneri TaxID=56779 RepID=A0A1N6ZSB4_9FIRM|nr:MULTISPECIES: ribonucleoside-triphosphate reductase, adenosylcobalamin-dependent [Halanaerobium]RCW52996.1 ribonucleoside-diphosphate reductase alpha chain/ribonucleoside-triphosphate reductase [Halanaerobium sp. ST460_2HS_T2]SIR29611.1 ribonucleoside-diphosphate reductase alpha chain/ribonucleoside-triphosphate reductase [Halanaerobium kushneri]